MRCFRSCSPFRLCVASSGVFDVFIQLVGFFLPCFWIGERDCHITIDVIDDRFNVIFEALFPFMVAAIVVDEVSDFFKRCAHHEIVGFKCDVDAVFDWLLYLLRSRGLVGLEERNEERLELLKW